MWRFVVDRFLPSTSEGGENTEALEDIYIADWTLGHTTMEASLPCRHGEAEDAAACAAATVATHRCETASERVEAQARAAKSECGDVSEGTTASAWSGPSLREDRSSTRSDLNPASARC